MKTKVIIFDSSTLISFAMACLFDEFRKLKENFAGKFLITKEVRWEIIGHPSEIKRFKLEALKLQQLIDDKILEMPASVGITNEEVSKLTQQILDKTNNTFLSEGKGIKIIDLGEASCLALEKILEKKKVQSVLAIDERTTRLFCENPRRLKKFLEKKLHTKISSKKEYYKLLKEIKIVRSTELIYFAYKKGLIGLKGDGVLDALLWSLRFKGCAISEDEIKKIKRLGK